MAAAEVLIQTALLGEALDTGPALVFVSDEDMRYIAVNESACRVLGYTRDELLQLRVSDIAREPEVSAHYDEMLTNGFKQGTAVLTRKDGSTTGFVYRATQTTVAGLPLFVCVGFASDD
jgi:PAS domain S-box-containing protein